MQLCYVGDPPAPFTAATWEHPPIPLGEANLWEIDAAFVFGDKPFTNLEREECQLVERSGRPVIRVGVVNIPLHRPGMSNVLMIRSFDVAELSDYQAWFASRPRTNYQSIACGLYDQLEAAITMGEPVVIAYRRANGDPVSSVTKLLGMKTWRSEEYVELEDHSWLRLDRIQTLNGEAHEANCTF